MAIEKLHYIFQNDFMYNSLWYQNLIKPFLAPADWIFAPIWAILYIMIFVALLLYMLEKYSDKAQGYIYFAIQLILNLLWSPVFFIFKSIQGALIIILLLDVFVFLTIKNFYSVSKISAILLIPYFIWILFATYLNLGYMILN